MTYKFHKDVLAHIMSHVAAYDLIVTSLVVENNTHYLMTLNGSIDNEEVSHLQENYGLEVV